mgnify:CR=1 FL=1
MERLAPAKVNLGLSVRFRREDGYHELHTLFAPFSLADRLVVEPVSSGLHFQGPYGRENLAYRAASLYLEAAGQPGGVRILLEKRIPEGAGLGGGSSDAAQVLLALQALYPAEVDLFALARTVGWISQWKEMIEDPSQKIGRPRQLYTGSPRRDYLPLSKRGK